MLAATSRQIPRAGIGSLMTISVENTYLRLAESLLREAGSILDSMGSSGGALNWIGREPKAAVDETLNHFFLESLEKTGVPILSEESEHNTEWQSGSPVWILDPLDGTLNFVRGTGPCAISLCLWETGSPKFGAVLDIASRNIYWGGRDVGSWCKDEALAVSVIDSPDSAVLCTGIPACFDFRDGNAVSQWVGAMAAFGKVRMIGSAASSLTLVAKGAADFYFEHNVKIWDVAAGIALVEGAGGYARIDVRPEAVTVSVAASNRHLASYAADVKFSQR
jgi:myo-inositol-1(or 4)-monophosphatase